MTLPPPGALLRGALAAAALLALCWFVGGQAALGRIDPALLLPLWPLPLAGLAWLARGASRTERRAAFGVAIALTLIGQALLAVWLAGAFPWLQLVLSAVGGSAAAVGADRMVQAAWPRWHLRVPLIAAAILGWFAAAHGLLALAYRAPAPRDVPVTMMTSLPLRWSGGDLAAMLADGARDDPALERIARGGRCGSSTALPITRPRAATRCCSRIPPRLRRAILSRSMPLCAAAGARLSWPMRFRAGRRATRLATRAIRR